MTVARGRCRFTQRCKTKPIAAPACAGATGRYFATGVSIGGWPFWLAA